MTPTTRRAQAGAEVVRAPRKNVERQRIRERNENYRKLNAPDEARKVAGCPKCPSWFPTVEARNEHRATEHAVAKER